jgi:MinD superfamily P-loop ATPase
MQMKNENTISSNTNYVKHMTIISGKGGTGKTTLTAAFTRLADKIVVADCDVDAADLHLVLEPEIQQSYSYRGGKKAVIDREKCTECNLCVEHCRFGAINNLQVDPLACEGCGFCNHICPENAVSMNEVISGYYHVSVFPDGDFVDAALQPGEGNSGKLVSEVKDLSKSIAEKNECKWLLIDGPPGIGCPVNASLAGVDYAIIITEPTVSGLHDLERVMQLIIRFRIPSAIVINKYDINPEMTNVIETYASDINLEIAGKIPFDDNVDRALLAGRTIMDVLDSPAAKEIAQIWERVIRMI